jgi:ribosomal protein S6
MSQFYEIMTIISPNESEEGVEAIIGGLRQQLTSSGGEILAVDIWGKRRLAYPINKFEEGIYVLFHAEGPSNMVTDFRRHTRIRESILRELIVKLDGAFEVAVRAKLEEQEPEDIATVEAQLEAAEQRAVEKLAQVTAPVTEATIAAAAGVEVVAAGELDAPVETKPAEEAPAEEAPAEEAPAEEAATEEAPAEEAPAEEAATEEAPAEEAPAEEPSSEETPAQEVVAEETSSEDAPAEEAAAEEAPSEQPPAVEEETSTGSVETEEDVKLSDSEDNAGDAGDEEE